MKYLHDKIPDRHCGACTECCSALAVAEIEKPLWEPCKHLCPKGCGIYESKPQECSKFECMWLRGFFGNDEHRPDKLGLVVARIKDKRLGYVLAVWESRPLALETAKVQYILDRISKYYYCYVFPYMHQEKRVILGPDLEKLQQLAEAV